ncbi:hypothetical protein V1514DRAFT_330668 [Lipomyces japonicus]|uniref:mitochondrial 54S ribosomal protein uL10m n=1 Tax=Lipomyces japonicus TaxID=56871 RepID=UPI0034CD66B4
MTVSILRRASQFCWSCTAQQQQHRLTACLASITSSLRKSYATASSTTTTAAATPTPTIRDTVKPLDSRKTFLVDRYTFLLRNFPLLVFVQHNNLLKHESTALRNQFKTIGADLTVLRTNLFKVALRNREAEDPASWEAHRQFRSRRSPFVEFLHGPTAVIKFGDNDAQVLKQAVEIVEKSAGRLMLLGAQFDQQLLSRDGIDRVKNLGSVDQVRGELAGVLEVLRGAGLVHTLQAAGGTQLYLTLQARKQQLEDPAEDKE